MFLQFTHGVPYINTLIFLLNSNVPSVCITFYLFSCLWTFFFLQIDYLNTASMNIHVQLCALIPVSNSF